MKFGPLTPELTELILWTSGTTRPKKLAYLIEYLRIYWTDFRNISPYESALHTDDGYVPYFPIWQGTLPWQPNSVAMMKANWYYMHFYTFARWKHGFGSLLLARDATAALSGMYARLCHAFLVFAIFYKSTKITKRFSKVTDRTTPTL